MQSICFSAMKIIEML